MDDLSVGNKLFHDDNSLFPTEPAAGASTIPAYGLGWLTAYLKFAKLQFVSLAFVAG